MLQVARRSTDIEWVLGDATTGGWESEFDLVVMSGHVIQVIMEEEDVRAAFAAIHAALTDDGRFLFATRNPLLRDWETWMPDQVLEFHDGEGTLIRKWHEITAVEGDRVYYTTTFGSEGWEQPVTVGGRQRFWSRDELSDYLSVAGLAIEEQFGDWDRSQLTEASPEIITIARRG
jgi:SAM-dependent methyltransferase